MGEKKYPENPAKEALRRYIPMLKRRDALVEEIEDHYSRAYRCTARIDPCSTGGGSAVYDRMAEDICRAADAKQQLAAKIAELNAAMQRVLALIDIPTDERQKTVLTLRYVNGLSWLDIQDMMGYERTQTLVLHGRALAAINRHMQKGAEMIVTAGMRYRGCVNGAVVEIVKADGKSVTYRDTKGGGMFTVGRKLFENLLIEACDEKVRTKTDT